MEGRERHFDKHIWQLPIPPFDAANPAHRRIVEIAKILEQRVAEFAVSDTLHFAATRRHIRELLAGTDEGQELNGIVFESAAVDAHQPIGHWPPCLRSTILAP